VSFGLMRKAFAVVAFSKLNFIMSLHDPDWPAQRFGTLARGALSQSGPPYQRLGSINLRQSALPLA
jgi:hypothetical protein